LSLFLAIGLTRRVQIFIPLVNSSFQTEIYTTYRMHYTIKKRG